MKKLYLLFAGLLILLIPNIGFSETTAKLRWDANTDGDLAFYRVYYGTASRDYGLPIKVVGATEYVFTSLEAGKTYYFAVTAVDTLGNESGYSSEVSKLIAASSTPVTLPFPSGDLISNLKVASGKPYVIKSNLAAGSQSYYDRTTYKYLGVPAELLNATYIQTSHGDMSLRGNSSFLSFDLNQNAVIYVVLDDLNKVKPAGMETFVDTGYDFKFYRNMSVFKKSYSPGKITFGTNTSGDMYTIIIKPE